ncbi:MAG TPA: NrpR regulatory domain-containing protein [Thermogutta sp.]|nr:NrpR regulatory domain-containing protein [Thermogutta sp.]
MTVYSPTYNTPEHRPSSPPRLRPRREDRKARHRLEILNVLRKTNRPLTSSQIAEQLASAGYILSERSIRLYLNELDAEGLTISAGHRGHLISDQGLAELRVAQTIQRVGYLSARIDEMTYKMTFDLERRTGTVVVNTSIINPHDLAQCLDSVCQVFYKGYAMGTRLAILEPGQRMGEVEIPPGRIGFCTVCSMTVNSVFLKHGIPTTSRFGGLLEVRNGQPTRFVEIIHYDGTSIDPLEIFIRGRMTDYRGAISTGNGLIGASFREIPEDARDVAQRLSNEMARIGLGSVLAIGLPAQPLLGIPVTPGRVGVINVAGLNPVAILEEIGYHVYSRALHGLMDFNQLITVDELPSILQRFLKHNG